jgi:hypothetical protein
MKKIPLIEEIKTREGMMDDIFPYNNDYEGDELIGFKPEEFSGSIKDVSEAEIIKALDGMHIEEYLRYEMAIKRIMKRKGQDYSVEEIIEFIDSNMGNLKGDSKSIVPAIHTMIKTGSMADVTENEDYYDTIKSEYPNLIFHEDDLGAIYNFAFKFPINIKTDYES